jgi:hypothetical protein
VTAATQLSGKEVVIMSRKRSLKNRYFRFLRRIWPAPTLAAIGLSLAACAARPVTSASAQTGTGAATAAADRPSNTGDELPYEWNPQLLPTKLHLAPELRSACAPIVTLPPSLRLDETEEVVDALEPIASCLTLGSLSTVPGSS